MTWAKLFARIEVEVDPLWLFDGSDDPEDGALDELRETLDKALGSMTFEMTGRHWRAEFVEWLPEDHDLATTTRDPDWRAEQERVKQWLDSAAPATTFTAKDLARACRTGLAARSKTLREAKAGSTQDEARAVRRAALRLSDLWSVTEKLPNNDFGHLVRDLRASITAYDKAVQR